ncbi:Zinc finger protein 18 [Plakobranchus ocellatus]|uniref:Zinc finger protein 18 n=1 Tax=Plakobranchus ocellatus TaxID=259542 RepID=A0AAV3YD00_9GAST|nr:Zinc finger protein 18 [Plakobranchus ocellatus]
MDEHQRVSQGLPSDASWISNQPSLPAGDGDRSTDLSYQSKQCSLCHTILPSSAGFKQHMSEFHGNFMPVQCSLCGKGFQSISGLNHHKLIHMGQKFRCSICEKTFTQKSKVKRHLITIHRCQPCQYCDGIFRIGQEYDHHIISCSRAKD